MNFGKRIFCRGFQAVMHALIPLFPYREPKLLEGIGEVAEELLDYIISVASGEETMNEKNNYREISIFKDGITL